MWTEGGRDDGELGLLDPRTQRRESAAQNYEIEEHPMTTTRTIAVPTRCGDHCPRRHARRGALTLSSGLLGLTLATIMQTSAWARPDSGIDTRYSATVTSAPAVARVGDQIVRCETGEGNLSGAGVPAPLTLTDVTSCRPGATASNSSAGRARQLEHDPMR